MPIPSGVISKLYLEPIERQNWVELGISQPKAREWFVANGYNLANGELLMICDVDQASFFPPRYIVTHKMDQDA